MDKQSSIVPNVEGFLLWLTGALVQYDKRTSRGPRHNPYALGHYMGAVQDIKKKMQSKLKSDAPEDLQLLKQLIQRHLRLPPSDRAVKSIDVYLQTGKAPNYPGTRAPKKMTPKKSAQRVFEKFAASFSPEELAALALMTLWKASHRKEYFKRSGLGEYNADNPYVKSLMGKGLVKLRGKALVPDNAKAREIMREHKVPERYERFIPNSHKHFKHDKEASSCLTVEEVADVCPKVAFGMITAGVDSIQLSDLERMVQAEGWAKLPKGWTQDSVDKFWDTLTGDRKHKVTACIKKMEGKVDDPGALCASLADMVDPGWRSHKKEAKKKTFPQAKKEIFDYLKRQGWTVKEGLKIPWAKDPDNDVQIWFKSQAVYGIGGLDGGRQKANFGEARSLHTDIREVTPQEFVKDVMRFLND